MIELAGLEEAVPESCAAAGPECLPFDSGVGVVVGTGEVPMVDMMETSAGWFGVKNVGGSGDDAPGVGAKSVWRAISIRLAEARMVLEETEN